MTAKFALLILSLPFTALLRAQAPPPDPQAVLQLAQSGAPALRQTLETLTKAADRQAGKAVLPLGGTLLFVAENATEPLLYVDGKQGAAMKKIAGSTLWYALAEVRTGYSHFFSYEVSGAKWGGATDVPAYQPECFPMPGVPQGKLSDKLTHTSHIYEGMKTDYWIYVPAQYDPKTPAALMVFQDGHGHINRDSGTRTMTVVDNLIAAKKIPVMILVFVDPGTVDGKAMRSIEYDTVSDKYPRFLRDELLPEVQAKYNIRKDAYSRAMQGASSGGICSFNAAWQMNDQFSRVLSFIGSFTGIQWHPDERGGNDFPTMVRKDEKHNIRVWLQDGENDLENNHGSWPLQNVFMANSLKFREYDFHLSFGTGTHNGAHGNAALPEELTWLWRGYNPAKTAETFVMDPAEKDKPYFRVASLNRE